MYFAHPYRGDEKEDDIGVTKQLDMECTVWLKWNKGN